MFKLQCNCSKVKDVLASARTIHPEVKAVFNEITAIARLSLVFPVSSGQYEWLFSSLRRLKTWLCTTMGQEKLNSSVVSHVHKELLHKMDSHYIEKDFASKSSIRRNYFGHI